MFMRENLCDNLGNRVILWEDKMRFVLFTDVIR